MLLHQTNRVNQLAKTLQCVILSLDRISISVTAHMALMTKRPKLGGQSMNT